MRGVAVKAVDRSPASAPSWPLSRLPWSLGSHTLCEEGFRALGTKAHGVTLRLHAPTGAVLLQTLFPDPSPMDIPPGSLPGQL